MQALSARLPLCVGDHHRAGAAVALVAALLGAGQASRLAQPVEQGARRRLARDADRRSVQQKRDLGHAVEPAAFFASKAIAQPPDAA